MITSQQLTRYYDEYRDSEVIFSKDMIHTLALDPRQIFVKCNGQQWPCIVNSSSFMQAKIVVSLKSGAIQELKKDPPPAASVKYTFFQPDGQALSFFINGKVSGFSTYMNNSELLLVTIQYTQRPPDDFIEIVGNILDANTNAQRHKDELIGITADSCRKLGISKKEGNVNIDGVPRPSILHAISFGGAQVILQGLSKFVEGKPVEIHLEFSEPNEKIALHGIISSTTAIKDRKDLFIANVAYTEEPPISYKININSYMSTSFKLEQEKQARAEKEAVKAAIQAQKSGASKDAAQ